MTSRQETGFRQLLAAHAPLIGTFIKTPSVQAIEILGELGFDFALVDEEHGPFDRGAIDLSMLAARAAEIAALVRVADVSSILSALDMGAAGVVVPHVDTAADAATAVSAARYRGGRRGFSPSPRAGRYGSRDLADHVASADATTAVIVMIEHPDAVRNVDAIAAVEGVDALFIGLGDLAVAMDELAADGPALRDAAHHVCRAARRHGKALMATAGTVEAGSWLFELGARALVVNSDQGLLRREAARQLDDFRSRSIEEHRTA